MFRRMLIGAFALIALVAAPAAAQYDFSVGPGNVTPGGDVTVSGEGCSAGAEVTITLTLLQATRAAVGESVVVATVTADANGEFNLTFQIPADAVLGRYKVEAFCDGASVGSAEINVVAPSSGGGGQGTIVRTGSDLNGLGLLGAGLLTAGGIILIATKSRRHRAQA